MNTKLTLNLDDQVIEEAKDYAKSHKTSLSQLVANYLRALISKEKEGQRVSPLVESLTGVIPVEQKGDDRKGYGEYLDKKYS